MEAPFKVGQKVVALKTLKNILIKDTVYTVLNIQQCGSCGRWNVSFLPCNDPRKKWKICNCEHNLIEDGNWSTDSSRFAPLPEQRERINYVAVSETLRETAVEIAAIETN